MELTGTLKFIGKEVAVSEKFRKIEFVLTDDSSKYPQHILFQLTQDRCELIESYSIGDKITVFFNLRGKEWTSPKGEVKYFNTIEAWKLDGHFQVNDVPKKNVVEIKNEDNDLPF